MNLDQIEAELLAAAKRAQESGLDIVSGQFRLYGEDARICGVCPLEAAARSGVTLPDAFHRGQFIRGFDGDPLDRGPGEDAYQLGLRLRAKLNPRPARV